MGSEPPSPESPLPRGFIPPEWCPVHSREGTAVILRCRGGAETAQGTHPRPGSSACSPSVALGQPDDWGYPLLKGREWRARGSVPIPVRGPHGTAQHWVFPGDLICSWPRLPPPRSDKCPHVPLHWLLDSNSQSFESRLRLRGASRAVPTTRPALCGYWGYAPPFLGVQTEDGRPVPPLSPKLTLEAWESRLRTVATQEWRKGRLLLRGARPRVPRC